MTDKFAKTHPWRATLYGDVPWNPGNEALGFQKAGERMARTKGKMQSFVDAIRAEHPAYVVSDVYRVGQKAA